MLKFAVKFSIKNDLKIIILSRQEKDHAESTGDYNEELDFYKKYLTNNELDYLLKRLFIRKRKERQRVSGAFSAVFEEVMGVRGTSGLRK